MESIYFETYHLILTDETKGVQTIYNLEKEVNDLKGLCHSFFDYMMGHEEEEDFPLIVDIVPLVRYYVEPAFKSSQLKDEVFGLTNGLFSLALIKVNYLEFQLKEFVQSKQVNKILYTFER